MTVVSDLIFEAYRELNLVPPEGVLTDALKAEGLSVIDRFIFSLLEFELGEFPMAWPVPPSETSPVPARFPLYPERNKLPATVWPYPPSNVNILMSLTADTTIYMPSNPDDGAQMRFINLVGASAFTLTVDGNGRLVQGASTFSGTPSILSQLTLLYRADLGDWTAISKMAATSESPLPYAYDTLLILGTAERIGTRLGKSLTATQERDYGRYLKRLKTQYAQSVAMPSASPQPFLTPQSSEQEFYGTGELG